MKFHDLYEITEIPLLWNFSYYIDTIWIFKSIFSSRIFYDYTEKYNENSKLFLKLQEKYPKFKKAVDEFDMRPNSKNKLTFCFMDPFQRLPR